MDVVGAVTAVDEGLRDLREIGGGVDALRRSAADTVEVRTQANVIDAGYFRNVVDVIDERAQRRAGDLGGPLAFDAVFIEVRNGLSGGFELVSVGLDGRVALFGLRFGCLAGKFHR